MRRIRGRIDVPLNDVGFAHARQAGEFLKDENIGKIYYSSMPRARQTAEAIAEKHSTKIELVEEPLVIDISWGDWEGKTYKECFGSDDGGIFYKEPEKLMIPNGESFYSVMGRLQKFLEKFWQSDEEVCTIVSHGAVINCFSLIIMQAPLTQFWSMYVNACAVSKIVMKDISKISVEYWNVHHFLKD